MAAVAAANTLEGLCDAMCNNKSVALSSIHAYRPKRNRGSSLTFDNVAFNRRDSAIGLAERNAVECRVSGSYNS